MFLLIILAVLENSSLDVPDLQLHELLCVLPLPQPWLQRVLVITGLKILSVCAVTKLSLTSNEHDADGKDLLRVGVGGDVPKAHTGQAAESEVQCCDVLIFDGGA